MDKYEFADLLKSINEKSCRWKISFFKINGRNWNGDRNPYEVQKIKFKDDKFILEYVSQLIKMLLKFRVEKIDTITSYTGDNPQASCNYIETSDDLVKEKWQLFVSAIADSSGEKIEKKYHGYIIEGNREGDDRPIMFIKVANPIIQISRSEGKIFTFDDDGCISMEDNAFRLYYDCDIIVYGKTMYVLNYRFEDLFHLDKTMKKLKSDAIGQMMAADAFDDPEHFKSYAESYSSPRTFLTLKEERVAMLKNDLGRRHIAEILGLEVSEQGRLAFRSKEQVSLLIKYVCFKIVQNAEDMELIEGNNLTRVSRT